jgi:hypothetical protein
MVRRTGLVALFAVVGAIAVAFFAIIGAAGAKKSDSKSKRMSGYLEVPSISSPTAKGTIEVRIRNSSTIDYKLTYSGLSSTSLFAHIHFAQPGVNGGVAAFLCGGNTKPTPCPATGGTVTGTITAGDVVAVNAPAPAAPGTSQGIAAGELAELIAAIKAGVTYANVHSQNFPGGEIRGQIKAKGGGDDDDD